MFCGHCGQEIAGWEKYCPNCGGLVSGNNYQVENKTSSERQGDSAKSTERRTVVEGSLHKCPNCGELVESFTSNCPACGHEFRDVNRSNTVKELAKAIELLEAQRGPIKRKWANRFYYSHPATAVDRQIVSLIRSFAIPNTKEDLFEFLILSESNIDLEAYDYSRYSSNHDDALRLISDAWKAQFEQAYQKALIICEDDPRLEQFKLLYDRTHKRIKQEKRKGGKATAIALLAMLVFWGSIACLIILLENRNENKEVQRLQTIEISVGTALEEEDYKLALANADRLVYTGSKESSKRDWKIKRNYWIDKVIEEAAEAGVELERPADPEEDSQESLTPAEEESSKD